MATETRLQRETLRLTLDAATFKELLRDLLFREAGKPYFKRLCIPRRHRWLGAWRRLSTYEAERALLPVGGRQLDERIRRFFTTHARLRAEFQESGMPVAAIRVLRETCPGQSATLEYVGVLECALDAEDRYCVTLTGGPAPPPSDNPDSEA
ncbi:MAG: hypothetical protein KatS3mg131_0525 [Candidatus Tectimicrobiota bacterium]|nr:MAG: hypothetical protein KatS3mg131_0525 [Candidatus Tectomicrobia bacterium]